MEWADDVRKMDIRANADTATDSHVALGLGAEGIGLCRTEHMFFDPEKIALIREMIVAPSALHRQSADKLLPIHKQDFKDIFLVLKELPVNIRLLDPPLHEFLSHDEEDIVSLAKSLDLSISVIRERFHALHEVNPMLGHRGVRLGITYPQYMLCKLKLLFKQLLKLKKNKRLM